MSIRLRPPETITIEISRGDWIRIKKHLTAGEQLDMFERVYDACGQRANDFVLSRKGLTLEWIIIILLAVQTFVLIFELL